MLKRLDWRVRLDVESGEHIFVVLFVVLRWLLPLPLRAAPNASRTLTEPLLRPTPTKPELNRSCPLTALPAEIKPCSRLLFQLAGEGSGAAPTLREAWAQRMHSVCGRVRQQASMLHKHSRPVEAYGAEGHGAPTKRQRTWA